MLEGISRMLKVNLSVFELDGEELSRKENPFAYMRRELEKKAEEGKRPVIVFDEIQRLKGVYMNSPNNQRSLVDELFNFFVRVTKILYFTHVLVMTSDTFFIEEVYSSSALKNTSRYYLVDYFDDEEALRILVDGGFSEEDARYVVERIGRVPWMMEEVFESEDVQAVIQELYDQALGKVYKTVRGREDLKEPLGRALSGENLYYEEKEIEGVKELVGKEMLFFDPINRLVKFQTKLDERATREILGAR